MIDVNSAREWWLKFGAEVYGPQAQEIAGEYLDEIERLQKERSAAFLMSQCQCAEGEACANLVRLHARVNELENSELAKEVERLSAQLADQRARDVRMVLLTAYSPRSFHSADDRELQIALSYIAEDYDRLAVIEVPPPKGGV